MAGNMKLPGSFSIFPKGPKPKSTAPHAQRTIDAAARAVRGAQRVIESLVSPQERGKQEWRIEAQYGGAGKAAQPQEWRIEAKYGGKGKTREKHVPGTFEQKQTEDLDPYGNYYFALEINGMEVGHFQECSGLKNASAIFEIQEGGLNGTVHKRPGQSKWENIILKYATSQSTFLLEWRDMWMNDMYLDAGGKDKRQKRIASTGSIAIINNAGKVVRRYEFTNAWPVSWEGPALNSGASGLAIETLEIAHDGLKLHTDAAKMEGSDVTITIRDQAKSK